jgi:hypothetical protein
MREAGQLDAGGDAASVLKDGESDADDGFGLVGAGRPAHWRRARGPSQWPVGRRSERRGAEAAAVRARALAVRCPPRPKKTERQIYRSAPPLRLTARLSARAGGKSQATSQTWVAGSNSLLESLGNLGGKCQTARAHARTHARTHAGTHPPPPLLLTPPSPPPRPTAQSVDKKDMGRTHYALQLQRRNYNRPG